MKKSLIGIGVLIGGIIESHGVIIAVASNLVDNWTTPPGRLVTTLIETGCIFPMFLSVFLIGWGLNIMWQVGRGIKTRER